jgi:hypothetical protein
MPDSEGAIGRVVRVTVSGGGELWPLTSDEALVLKDYRHVRDEGRGSLYVEFADQKVTKYDVRVGGGVQRLNVLLGKKLRS